jgi:antitoxin VapB
MGISIKNPEAERLIRQLAEMTGEGQTEAVMNAVRERIERLSSEKKSRLEKIMAISRKTAPLLRDMPDHGDYLYDPVTGLPK